LRLLRFARICMCHDCQHNNIDWWVRLKLHHWVALSCCLMMMTTPPTHLDCASGLLCWLLNQHSTTNRKQQCSIMLAAWRHSEQHVCYDVMGWWQRIKSQR
jgi:hypothetical protein